MFVCHVQRSLVCKGTVFLFCTYTTDPWALGPRVAFVLPFVNCVQRNMVREGTVFLLDALAGDKAEEAALQTKLLEINLVTNPQVCRDRLLAVVVVSV
jgi:hypothetical protein